MEYYREQYRMLKSENESLRDKIDDLGEEVESAKVYYLLYVGRIKLSYNYRDGS